MCSGALGTFFDLAIIQLLFISSSKSETASLIRGGDKRADTGGGSTGGADSLSLSSLESSVSTLAPNEEVITFGFKLDGLFNLHGLSAGGIFEKADFLGSFLTVPSGRGTVAGRYPLDSLPTLCLGFVYSLRSQFPPPELCCLFE